MLHRLCKCKKTSVTGLTWGLCPRPPFVFRGHHVAPELCPWIRQCCLHVSIVYICMCSVRNAFGVGEPVSKLYDDDVIVNHFRVSLGVPARQWSGNFVIWPETL